MSALLQVSDPHFGTEQAPVVTALERLSLALAPDVLVMSGDITQRATRAQFATARAFIDRLAPKSLLAIPGNHDIPLFQLAARAFTPYGRYSEVFGDELEPVLDTADWLVIGVKTTRRWRHEDGEVSHAQVERVAQRLAAAAPTQLRVVVTHQPVAVTRPEDVGNRLHGADAAVARWSAAGADLVLGGHIHLPFVLPLHQRMDGLPRPVWAVQAGTAVSSRVRSGHPNSVNVVRAEAGADECCVERWDYAAADGAFVLADTVRLSLASRAARP